MPYASRHGFGYSVFEHTERGIRSEMWVYVALDAQIKFTVLKVRNESGRSRRLSATGYVEWVLGDLRSKSAMHVITRHRSRERSALRTKTTTTQISPAGCLFPRGRCDPDRERGPDGVPWAERHPSRSGCNGPVQAFRQGGGRMIPALPSMFPSIWADGQEREIVFILA